MQGQPDVVEEELPDKMEDCVQTGNAWQAFFCPRVQRWWFWSSESGESTWERPAEPCVVLWERPAVPEPWVVEEDAVTGELSFWNEFYVEDGRQVGKRQGEVPTELPPCEWPYVARLAADGLWEYVDTATGVVNRGIVPMAPEGWQVGWSGAQQSWFWRNCVTGEATFDPPGELRVSTSSVESLVA